MSNTNTPAAKPARPSIDELMAWENGELDQDAEIDLFQRLISSGMIYALQGCYGRRAQQLINDGSIERP